MHVKQFFFNRGQIFHFLCCLCGNCIVSGTVRELSTYEGARSENVIVSNRESLDLYCVVNVSVIERCFGHGNFEVLATFYTTCRSRERIFVVPSSVPFCSSPFLFDRFMSACCLVYCQIINSYCLIQTCDRFPLSSCNNEEQVRKDTTPPI